MHAGAPELQKRALAVVTGHRAMRSRRRTQVRPAEPALGWTYLSRDALARAKAQMDAESVGVRDEVGFLVIHQRYADHFFPGTSVLHTRARYALFVPWLFEDLAGLTGPAAVRALREKERVLAGRLKDAGEFQVIGSRVFPKASSQPPSTVYWNALATWGIMRPRLDGRTISRAQAHKLLKKAERATDDDGQPLLSFDPPFVPLPERPETWQGGLIDLRLEAEEAAFLRERLAQLRGNDGRELSLLARLVRSGTAAPADMWADEIAAVAGPDRPTLARARQAASLSGIGRAIYDALLENVVEVVDRREISRRHRVHMTTVVQKHARVAAAVDVAAVEEDIGVLPSRLYAVLTATLDWLKSGSDDIAPLFSIYSVAEARKGSRARLALTPDGRARRLEWSSDEHGLAVPLHYRWHQVATLLDDLANAA